MRIRGYMTGYGMRDMGQLLSRFTLGLLTSSTRSLICQASFSPLHHVRWETASSTFSTDTKEKGYNPYMSSPIHPSPLAYAYVSKSTYWCTITA